MHYFSPIIVIILFLQTTIAHSQSIGTLRSFTYGDLIIVDNDAPRSMVITPSGAVISNSNEIFVTSDGNSARFFLSGFDTFTAVSVSFSPTNLIFNAVGPQFFTLSNFATDPSSIVTNGAGAASFNVGTTLSTSGDGNFYQDGAYTGTVEVTVFF